MKLFHKLFDNVSGLCAARLFKKNEQFKAESRVAQNPCYKHTTKEMKTYKKWEKSNLDMDVYLSEPCEIDEELYLDILECVPTHYSGELAQQGGDAIDSFKNEKGKEVFTYMTVNSINGKYFYLGILPEFKG